MKIVIKNLNINIYTASENLSKDIEQLKKEVGDFNQNENQTKKYKPSTKGELIDLINGKYINLGDIDTSLITDMSCLFYISNRNFFSGIETWDVSNVKDMSGMFKYTRYNGDISKWNVSNVEKMDGMFAWSGFNQDISNWDTSRVSDMYYMFAHSDFNQDISNWKINKNCYVRGMFEECPIKEEFKPHIKEEE